MSERGGRRFGAASLTIALGICLTVAAQQPSVRDVAAGQIQGTGAISGVVIDGTTKLPVAGAIVSLSSSSRGGTFASRVITDAKGRFVFHHLPASDAYVIRTNKFGYTDSLGKTFPAGNSRIALDDGEWISNAEVVLWKPASVSGIVLDERGEPLVGVPVRALAQISVAGSTQLAAGPVTTTDDRGAYRIAGLVRGRYLVTVPSVQSTVPTTTPPATLAGVTPETFTSPNSSAWGKGNAAGLDLGAWRLVIGNYAIPTHVSGRVMTYPTVFYPAARSPTTATVLDLKDGEERTNVDLSVPLVPTVTVAGQVRGPQELFKNLLVRLLPEGSENIGVGGEAATALTASDGRFTFLGVPAGSYSVDVSTSVAEITVRGTSALGNLPPTPGMIRGTLAASAIRSAPDGTAVSIRSTTVDDAYWGRLHLGVGATDLANVIVPLRRSATLSGRLVFEGNASTGNRVRVSVEPATGSGALAVAGLSASADATGPDTFAFRGLKGGQYFLRIGSGADVIVKSIVANGDYTDRPFDAASGDDITGVVVTLTDKVGSISGNVVDRQGLPLSQAAVIVFPTDPVTWTNYGFDPPRIKATSAVGKRGYSLTGLPKGEYFVLAVAPSLVDAWQDSRFFPAAAAAATRVTLDWGETKLVNLVLREVSLR